MDTDRHAPSPIELAVRGVRKSFPTRSGPLVALDGVDPASRRASVPGRT